MARRARPLSSVELAEPYFDFARGLIGGQTDAGVRPRHLRYADNVEFEPIRGLSLRKGYRDVNGFVLPAGAHSLMIYYAANGVATFFAAAAAKLYKIDTTGYTEQTLPITPSATGKWTHANLNGVLIAVQQGANNVPIFYTGTGWLSCVFPTPAAPTLTSTTNAGGVVDVGTRFYRLRYLFANGASLVSATLSVTVSGVNLTVNLALPAAPAGRTDYTSVWIERTRAGAVAGGPYYFVAIVATPTVAYADLFSDGALTERIQPGEPGTSGAAPTLDGLVSYRSRLIGWKGSDLYIGQGIGDVGGSGILNFNPAQQYPVKRDDGDPIQLCLNTPLERLVILKGASGHALDGYDPTDFSLTQLFDGIGAAGPRAAAVVENGVVFYAGQGRLFVTTQSVPRPFGDFEVGHYLKKITATDDANVCLFNYRGSHLLVGYAEAPDTYNRHALVYRMAYKNWTHWKEFRFVDAIAPKRPENAGGVTILFADPKSIDGASQAGAGGRPAFATWRDNRANPPEQTYVQKINASGQPAWTANGVVVSASVNGDSFYSDYSYVLGLADGGCVVLYVETTSPKTLRAKRLDSSGANVWGGTGIVLAATTSPIPAYPGDPNCFRVIPDGGSGFFFVWCEARSSGYRVYAQRTNSAGVVQWTANGVAITTPSGDGAGDTADTSLAVFPDLAGGFYVAWNRTLTSGGFAARGQRVTAAGAVVWVANGVSLSGPNTYGNPAVCVSSDGYLTSIQNPSSTVVLKRFAPADGAVVWTTSNVEPAGTAIHTASFTVVAGLSGGVFALWAQDLSNGGGTGTMVVRARLVNSAGVASWAAPATLKTFTNIATNNLTGYRTGIRATEDGSGGAIVCFLDYVLSSGALGNLYTAKVASDGTTPWSTSFTVSNRTGYIDRFSVATDGAGGAIVAYHDATGTGGATNVFTSRIRSNGNIDWTANGVAMTSGQASTRFLGNVGYSSAIESQFPAGVSLTGFHVWVGFTGYSDEAAFDGSGGVPINWYIETPEIDDGALDVLKDYIRLAIFVKTGTGSFAALVSLDAGRQVSLPLDATRSTAKWGTRGGPTKVNTLIWGPRSSSSPLPDNPRKWAGQRTQEITVGFPNSTVGSRYRLALRAALQNETLVEGFVLDFRPLPERPLTP